MSNPNLKRQLITGAQDLSNARDKLFQLIDEKKRTLSDRKAKIRIAAEILSEKVLPEGEGVIPRPPPTSLFEVSRAYHELRKQAQIDTILSVADQQRSQKNFNPELLDEMIYSCYQPLSAEVPANSIELAPQHIIGVFFEDEYLSRARYPVPYIIIPAFAEGLRWAWISVAHETGHHVYWQVKGLRDELDVRVADALSRQVPDYQIQRLYFHCLEETFSDLYGLLMMGRAYLLSGQALFLYGSISAYQANQPPSDPAEQHQLIQDSLFTAKNSSYPPPIVRGNLALYAYQKLMKSQDPVDVGQWNADIAGNFKMDQIPNPHSHSPKWTEHRPELPYQSVLDGMSVVVDVLLTSKLSTLNGRSLEDLVHFAEEEEIRNSLLKKRAESGVDPQSAEEIVKWAKQNGITINQDAAWRYWIATEYLLFHPSLPA